MSSKNKFCKLCFFLSSSIAAISFVGVSFINSSNTNDIVKSEVHSFRTSNISGNITTVDQYSYVEVNLSGYDIDLNKYIVNVDQTSETGIPLNNSFQIDFKIISKNQFRISRTSARKYYKMYILDKKSNNPYNDKQYFATVIKVDNFANNGSSIPNNKIESSISIVSLDDTNMSKFKSYFIDKGFFKKELGFNKELISEINTWDMGKVYDEMNGILFNISNKNTFVSEAKEVGFVIDYDAKNEIETLNFWIILKEQYFFKINNSGDFIVTANFQIERDLPPPPLVDGNNAQQNLNSSSNQKTIFIASSSAILLFIIAIVLFVIISNKNKNKLKRNYSLEKAIKNRKKL